MAIPKKGRLNEKIVTMLKGCGIDFQREHRLDVALCKDLPLTLVFLPASDIAKYVGEGNVDIGITGIDICEESDVDVDRILKLGIGKCKLCVQGPVANRIKDARELAGKRIVTSFPLLTKKFFDPLDEEKGVKTKIKFVSGSVEAACSLGLADGIVDLVETGTTMRVRIFLSLLFILIDIVIGSRFRDCFRYTPNRGKTPLPTQKNKSNPTQAVLITNKKTQHDSVVKLIKRRVEGYITATKYLMITYNVHVDLLEKASAITPGKRSPTVTGLEDPNYKAVSSLVLKSQLSIKMDQLHDVGATDILAVDLCNTRM